MKRTIRLLLLAAAVISAGGCGFSVDDQRGVSGWFDPYHETMRPVNAEFTHNPFPMVPTMIGNVIGVGAFLPLTAIAGALGHPADDPHSYFEYAASASGYFGGAIVGGPFVLLNLVFVRWWYDWAFPPEPERAAPPPARPPPERNPPGAEATP